MAPKPSRVRRDSCIRIVEACLLGFGIFGLKVPYTKASRGELPLPNLRKAT